MSREPETIAYVALGSNVGDRHAMIDAGCRGIEALPKTHLMRRSSVIQTPAWGPVKQDPYLNAVVLVRTSLSARALLDGLLAAEMASGRDRAREQRWGPRTLDLDLLIFGEQVINEPGLRVPHPRLTERAFVLIPLAELSPTLVFPGTQQTVQEWLAKLSLRSNHPPEHAGTGVATTRQHTP